MISFGPRSILLLVGTAHGLVLAALLLRAPANRVANRLLALLLTAVALRVVPYIIGFAGFYDAYPWLSYLPYDWSLGYGALIWLYARVICSGELPRRWQWHLVPAAMQGAYYSVMFVQPLKVKNLWTETIHDPRIVPIETIASFITMSAYLALAWREYSAYQRWLDDDLSNREEFRLSWLRTFLLAFGATLCFWMATSLVDAFVQPLNYFDRFPLYLWFSLLIYGLGLGGLRSARVGYPRPGTAIEARTHAADDLDEGAEPASTDSTLESAEAIPESAGASATAEALAASERRTDWSRLGQRWSELVREQGWWRDADLTAPRLAQHLATNTSYLSRALNEGLGQNFNEFVNRLRIEAIQVELAKANLDRDVLAVALDAGFNSKASFNRVFKRLTGETPTDFRRRQGLATSQDQ